MRRLLTSLLLVLLALESRTVAPAATPADPDVDEFVRGEMDRQHVPGVAIGIIKNGAVLKARGYGYANVEHMVPVGPDGVGMRYEAIFN